jgi:uncharacterized membrane protein YccC
MLASLLARLHDLVTLWRECRELRRKVTAGERAKVRDEPPAPHRDRAMAALSAVAAAVATLLACSFWITSAWPEGGTAATMAAVLACLFAATDDPAPFALAFLWCTVASAIVAGVYLLGVLPLIDGFPLLAAALACFFVPVAALLPVPALFPYAMPLVVNAAAFMAIQDAYAVDVASYVNGAVAQIVGMGIAVIVLRLVRSVGATVAARRLAAATQADLARLAAGDAALGRARFEARALDRVGALLPRLREADPDQRRRLLDGSLLDLRLGLNLLYLHERLRRRPDAASGSLDALLRDLAAFFRRRDPVERASPPALLARLDDALARLGAAEPSVSTTATLLALAGMRRALFPDAARPGPSEDEGSPRAMPLETAA